MPAQGKNPLQVKVLIKPILQTTPTDLSLEMKGGEL